MSLATAKRAGRTEVALEQRITALQKGPQRLKQAIALIGPGDGDARLCDAAFAIAQRLAQCGLAIVCGGRGGVMQAASRGAYEAGGTVIGLLPENDDRSANAYLTVAIPTGMGEMRNALIARSSLCLVALGGGMGTLSEMAFGLKLGKPVFCLYPEFELPGATRVASVDEAVDRVLEWLLAAVDTGEAFTHSS
jgi:uncharacterized protein (TIGR00725 family)